MYATERLSAAVFTVQADLVCTRPAGGGTDPKKCHVEVCYVHVVVICRGHHRAYPCRHYKTRSYWDLFLPGVQFYPGLRNCDMHDRPYRSVHYY